MAKVQVKRCQLAEGKTMTFRKMTIAFINLIDILEVFDRIFYWLRSSFALLLLTLILEDGIDSGSSFLWSNRNTVTNLRVSIYLSASLHGKKDTKSYGHRFVITEVYSSQHVIFLITDEFNKTIPVSFSKISAHHHHHHQDAENFLRNGTEQSNTDTDTVILSTEID